MRPSGCGCARDLGGALPAATRSLAAAGREDGCVPSTSTSSSAPNPAGVPGPAAVTAGAADACSPLVLWTVAVERSQHRGNSPSLVHLVRNVKECIRKDETKHVINPLLKGSEQKKVSFFPFMLRKRTRLDRVLPRVPEAFLEPRIHRTRATFSRLLSHYNLLVGPKKEMNDLMQEIKEEEYKRNDKRNRRYEKVLLIAP